MSAAAENLDVVPRQQGAPAQDLDAEMSVLGAMLLGGKDAVGEILDCPMRPRDYYRPAHETIHAA
ncbi:DnaB-like helicase N-terminal domain-containing protein, partial [Streptomyces sp. NPDC102437]|uniref:DnaB-like helicase N-terminal domain-containing protein n=1 Tax=Streptomyces sp. NPDC102437 TaxID=3366175 RepID=UPI0037FD74F5